MAGKRFKRYDPDDSQSPKEAVRTRVGDKAQGKADQEARTKRRTKGRQTNHFPLTKTKTIFNYFRRTHVYQSLVIASVLAVLNHGFIDDVQSCSRANNFKL